MIIKQGSPNGRNAIPNAPTSTNSSPSLTPTKPPIPILKIPSRSESVPGLNTRSSRREYGVASGRSSVDSEFVQTPTKLLMDLATRLGETCIQTSHSLG